MGTVAVPLGNCRSVLFRVWMHVCVCVCLEELRLCLFLSLSLPLSRHSTSTFHPKLLPCFSPLNPRIPPSSSCILHCLVTRRVPCPPRPQTHTTWGEICYNSPVSPLLVKHTMTTVSAPDGLAALERHVHVAVAALVVDGAGCGVDGAGGLVGGGGLLGLVG